MAFVSNFATMLSAGISILDIVDSLLEEAKGNQKKMLEIIKADTSQGQHLYISMAKFPRVFDRVTVSLIKAAEEAGTLDTALVELRDKIKKDAEFMDKVKAAMTYPIFVVLLMIAVFTMILVVVMPKISQVFSRLRVTMPLPTKIMIATSNFLLDQTIPIIIGIILMIVIFIYLYKTQKQFLIAVLFKMPMISKLIIQIDLTQFTRSLYYLLNSAIPITTALELTTDVVVTKRLQRVIINSRAMVSSGKQLSQGLKTDRKIIPSLMVRIIEGGEKTGTLDKSLLDISEYMEYQVANRLRVITALLEPILLVVIGIGIGGMMIAIIGPIYGMIGQVGAR